MKGSTEAIGVVLICQRFMFMAHPFPHKPVRVRAACDLCSLVSQWAMPDPERRRTLGGKTQVTALFNR